MTTTVSPSDLLFKLVSDQDELNHNQSKLRNSTIHDIKFGVGDHKVFTNLDLTNVTFIDCTFDGVKFKNCDLAGATFIDCKFIGVRFSDCILDTGKFLRCNLEICNFGQCNMMSCRFEEVVFFSSTFSTCNMTNIYINKLYSKHLSIRHSSLMRACISNFVVEKLYLWGTVGNGVNLKSLNIDNTWVINYTSTHMQIGCERHTFEQWKNFSDEEISAMSLGALPFWEREKDFLFSIINHTPAEEFPKTKQGRIWLEKVKDSNDE